MFEQKHALRSGMVKNWADAKIVSAQFYSFSYLQLKCLKEDNEVAVLQCCWCCPPCAVVFCAIFASRCLFFYFCAVCGPVLHPCQLSTRFRIFLKPHFLLHQSVFCLHETSESAYQDRTWNCFPDPGGGEGTPYDGYRGRLRPKVVPFSGFRCIKG